MGCFSTRIIVRFVAEWYKKSRQQLASSIQAETPNIFMTLDRCLEAYRSYCQSWIHLAQLKQAVVIMAENYIKTVSN